MAKILPASKRKIPNPNAKKSPVKGLVAAARKTGASKGIKASATSRAASAAVNAKKSIRKDGPKKAGQVKIDRAGRKHVATKNAKGRLVWKHTSGKGKKTTTRTSGYGRTGSGS